MGKHKTLMCSVIILSLFLSTAMCTVPSVVKSKSLDDCQACKVFIESFKKGLERTAHGKYEEGDTAREEEKFEKSYRRSEMRLVDIQDSICKEERKHSIQCHQYAEKAKEYIEQWWAQEPDESDDLYTYVCIENLKVCCPKHHFGKDCTPCPGDHSNLCSGTGKCRGAGTRKGNGNCLCDEGYTGLNCDICDVGFYQSYKDENKMLCSPCHLSCSGACRGSTQKDCEVCKTGFSLDTEEGCMDINECEDRERCTRDEFCVNSIGSYKCLKCDRSCNGCHGDGPDMCTKCAKGYSKKGDLCLPVREYEDVDEKLTATRYMMYVGLLVSTAILLPNSTFVGYIIGAMVLSYIIVAEYYCMINGHQGLVNFKDFDLVQILHT